MSVAKMRPEYIARPVVIKLFPTLNTKLIYRNACMLSIKPIAT